MFAVNHAATAFLIKRRYPSVSLVPILLSVQAMELAWVALNYLGIERTETNAAVHTVADVHLAHMPYSHSVAVALGAALGAWLLLEKGLGRVALGRAVGLGIASHLVLDLATHGRDIVLTPSAGAAALGLGLYEAAPAIAFAVELGYGLYCWWSYGGGPRLLALVVIGNLANLSMFSSALRGPEELLAGRPQLVVTLVFVQIVVTLALAAVFARKERGAKVSRESADDVPALAHGAR